MKTTGRWNVIWIYAFIICGWLWNDDREFIKRLLSRSQKVFLFCRRENFKQKKFFLAVIMVKGFAMFLWIKFPRETEKERVSSRSLLSVEWKHLLLGLNRNWWKNPPIGLPQAWSNTCQHANKISIHQRPFHWNLMTSIFPLNFPHIAAPLTHANPLFHRNENKLLEATAIFNPLENL